jgi:hypothetical protein
MNRPDSAFAEAKVAFVVAIVNTPLMLRGLAHDKAEDQNFEGAIPFSTDQMTDCC